MKVRIDHLDANPFRHIDRYPIREDKIAALMESINSTGFWDNMVGRRVGDRVQIAYGHHRREALRRAYGPSHEIGIVVRDFDDDQMLKIMARENMEEWGSSASIEHETVRAVVEAYGAGQVTLTAPAVENKRSWRYAPLFTQGRRATSPAAPYDAKTVADFLGWSQDKVREALQALALVEQGHLADADFAGLTTSAAEALVRETNHTLREQERAREAEARALAEIEQARAAAAEREARAEQERAAARERSKAAKERAEQERAEREFAEQEQRRIRAAQERQVAEQARASAEREAARREAERTKVRKDVTQTMRTNLRDPKVGIDNARKKAQGERAKYTPDNSAPMDFGQYVHRLALRLSRLLTEGDLAEAFKQVRRYREHIPPAEMGELVAALEEIRDEASRQLKLLGYVVNTEGHLDQMDSTVIDGEVIDFSADASRRAINA